MKKVIVIWAALIFLLIDTRITGVIKYPEYIPFDSPAINTVNMVIGHLIGDSAPLDLFSDAVGFLLILFVMNRIMKESKKAFRAFAIAFLGLVMYIANWTMPFFLNGRERYAAGYFLYLAYQLVKCFATIQAGLVCCEMAESQENHARNNVVAIFLILAAATGFIRGCCFFYELRKTMIVYYGIQIFFTVLYSWVYWKGRDRIRPQRE